MKTLIKINDHTYLYDDQSKEKIQVLDENHLILFILSDYNKINEKLEKVLTLYKEQNDNIMKLIEVVKLNNEAVRAMRKEIK